MTLISPFRTVRSGSLSPRDLSSPRPSSSSSASAAKGRPFSAISSDSTMRISSNFDSGNIEVSVRMGYLLLAHASLPALSRAIHVCMSEPTVSRTHLYRALCHKVVLRLSSASLPGFILFQLTIPTRAGEVCSPIIISLPTTCLSACCQVVELRQQQSPLVARLKIRPDPYCETDKASHSQCVCIPHPTSIPCSNGISRASHLDGSYTYMRSYDHSHTCIEAWELSQKNLIRMHTYVY